MNKHANILRKIAEEYFSLDETQRPMFAAADEIERLEDEARILSRSLQRASEENEKLRAEAAAISSQCGLARDANCGEVTEQIVLLLKTAYLAQDVKKYGYDNLGQFFSAFERLQATLEKANGELLAFGLSREQLESFLGSNAAAKEKVCEWRQNDDGDWETGCDNIFCYMAGTPIENNSRFCMYCGGKVVVK